MQPIKPQVDPKVTMENGPEVMAGEPIVLHYAFTNTSPYEGDWVVADFEEHYAKLATLTPVGEKRNRSFSATALTRHLPVIHHLEGIHVVTF